MGGNAALIYAGTEAERVTALVTIEGIGPPGRDPMTAPESFSAWLEDLERVEHRQGRGTTLDEATNRLRVRFPAFSEEVARHMAEFGTREHAGKRFWKFDPLHQTRSPQPYYLAQGQAFWRRIVCPVLYVEGTASFITLPSPDVAERLAVLGANRATIEGAGHHPHLERPEELSLAILKFLKANGLS